MKQFRTSVDILLEALQALEAAVFADYGRVTDAKPKTAEALQDARATIREVRVEVSRLLEPKVNEVTTDKGQPAD
jgi:hypothetical protein